MAPTASPTLRLGLPRIVFDQGDPPSGVSLEGRVQAARWDPDKSPYPPRQPFGLGVPRAALWSSPLTMHRA